MAGKLGHNASHLNRIDPNILAKNYQSRRVDISSSGYLVERRTIANIVNKGRSECVEQRLLDFLFSVP